MKTMLSSIDLVIECRDYRVPLTSRNPLFEASLSGRERLIVYTKRDLGSVGGEEDGRVGGDHISAGRLAFPIYVADLCVCVCVERRDHPAMAPPLPHPLF
jgi:hypothetical protein